MKRGYAAVGLSSPKDHYNIGGVLRALGVYDGKMLVTTGQRYKRHSTDTMKAYRHLPFLQVGNLKDTIPYDCVPVAVDLIPGAIPLQDYVHPERAFYIFGPEDGTLGEETTSYCRDTIYIPTIRCMNLAATVNVVLYDRLAKQLRLK